jgi:transposase-like protein
MEQRYEAVMAVLRDGEPVSGAAARFGVSRQTVHAWISRYHGGGISALADGSVFDLTSVRVSSACGRSVRSIRIARSGERSDGQHWARRDALEARP